jgi:hypothetical protein
MKFLVDQWIHRLMLGLLLGVPSFAASKTVNSGGELSGIHFVTCTEKKARCLKITSNSGASSLVIPTLLVFENVTFEFLSENSEKLESGSAVKMTLDFSLDRLTLLEKHRNQIKEIVYNLSNLKRDEYLLE